MINRGFFVKGALLLYRTKIFVVLPLLFFQNTVFGASCLDGYDIVNHDIDLDFNINTPEYPSAISAITKDLNANTFILSDDGNCYAGYEPYTKTGGDVYPLIENSDLCENGYYRANGTCTPFTDGGCPSGRYNSAVMNTTFVASEDGNCYNGFDVYSRKGDDVYPLLDSSSLVLCDAGQYPANGICTPYSVGTCPENMLNTTVNSATWATMTNGVCPSNYVEQSIEIIEYACDTYENHITSDTPACLLMCANGNIFTEVNSCAALCPDHHKFMTDTGLEFPMYATKQITPSLNIQLGKNTCYVNLVPGNKSESIHIKYNEQTYHTVK